MSKQKKENSEEPGIGAVHYLPNSESFPFIPPNWQDSQQDKYESETGHDLPDSDTESKDTKK